MKKFWKLNSLVAVGIAFFLASCAVQNPGSEEIFPAMKAASVQFFILGQPIRWMTLTNESTPYAITDFSVKDVVTNILLDIVDDVTNYVTNIVCLANIKANMKNVEYTASFDLDFSLKDDPDAVSFNEFTDLAEFNEAVSNASLVRVSGSINYKLGDVSLTTLISNYTVTTENSGVSIFTNYLNSQKAFNNTSGYVGSEGSINKVPFFIYYGKGMKLGFVDGREKGFENLEGSVNVYLSYDRDKYVYKFDVKYDPLDYNAELVDIEKFAETIVIDLIEGE
jgi:hypothetical protein